MTYTRSNRAVSSTEVTGPNDVWEYIDRATGRVLDRAKVMNTPEALAEVESGRRFASHAAYVGDKIIELLTLSTDPSFNCDEGDDDDDND